MPASWKASTVDPVFKSGDPTNSDGYRAIALVSCAFTVFDRLVHGRIAPGICDRHDEGQGGFRWGADARVYGLVDALLLRQEVLSFAAFVDIRKAFDTAWVEAHWFATWTLALLRGCGAPWPTSPMERYHKFGTPTESLPLGSTRVSRKVVFCLLPFNLLVNTSAAGICLAAPEFRQTTNSQFRFSCHL